MWERLSVVYLLGLKEFGSSTGVTLDWIPVIHTGKCIRRFAGIYAYCRYFIDRKW